MLTTVSFINGYWQLLVGPTRKQAFKHKSKRKVENKRAKLLDSKILSEDAINKETFLKLYKEFYELKEKRARHPNSRTEMDSVSGYEAHYRNYLVPYMKDDIRISMFGVPELEDLLTQWMNAGVKFKTYERTVRFIKTFFNHCVSYRKITREDAQTILNYSLRDNPDFLPATDEEMNVDHGKMITPSIIDKSLKVILADKSDPDRNLKYILIAVLSFTGMRASELIALQWKHINFDRHTISVVQRKIGSIVKKKTKKAGSNREFWIPPKLYTLLKEWKRIHSETYLGNVEWLFPQSFQNESIPYDWLRLHLYLTYEKLGLVKVKKIYNKDYRPGAGGNSLLRIVVDKKNNIFRGCPTKCFRKFVAHYLLKSGPAISDQEKLQHIGHRDLKQTKEYAGDVETAMEISIEDPESRNQKLVALDKTFPINPKNF